MKEQVIIGGEDFTETDPFAHVVLEKLGNERFSRHIINIVLKAFFELEREGTYWVRELGTDQDG